MDKANREKWATQRKAVLDKVQTKTEQKIVDTKSDNAVIAERIRTKLLKRLEKEIDGLPEQNIGTEKHSKIIEVTANGKKEITKVIKYRDLVTAYKELLDEDFRRERLQIDHQKADNAEW